jgi:hypothetical protein
LEDTAPEQVEPDSAVHLSLEYLHAVDLAFDGVGAPGQGQPGGGGGEIVLEALSERVQLGDVAVEDRGDPLREPIAAQLVLLSAKSWT